MNYHLTPAKSLHPSINFKRIGIVPFFIENNNPKFFLMIDSKFKELTDCGGIPKRDETWIETAVREAEEESRGIFIFDRSFLVHNGLIFWREDHRIAIVFIDITVNVNSSCSAVDLCHRYRKDYLKGVEMKEKRELLENSDMEFLDEFRILDICRNRGNIYTPVKMLFLKFFRQKHQKYLIDPFPLSSSDDCVLEK